jgi:dihydrolipoamide dehydrogenase
MVVGEFSTEIDTLIIGAGPGGYVAAIRAAQLGQSVTLVDKDELGGVCLNRGCIPSKALISAAHRYEEALHGDEIGIQAKDVTVDFAKVQAWKNGVVKKLTGGVATLMKANKVNVIKGEALFVSPNEVRVYQGYESTRYKFKNCIIATGSRPIELKAFPFGKRILSSTEALNLQEIPKSMIVIGGGYIGIELGQTYAKFGTKVTILEGAKSILPGFDSEITRWVERSCKRLNIDIHTNAMAQSASQTDNDVTVTFKVGDEEKSVTAEYVLVTVGRIPNTNDLGLDVAGVELDERNYIKIDDQCRTNVPGIYAIGDIVKGPALAHKASYEAKVAAEAISGLPSKIDYQVIPSVVFSDPEIATVGMSESQAKEQGIEVVTGRVSYGANGRALALNQGEGFVKIVAEKHSKRLIGAQIVGAEASNLIAEMGLAIETHTVLEDIALTIHAHPTLGEMIMEAAEAGLGQASH